MVGRARMRAAVRPRWYSMADVCIDGVEMSKAASEYLNGRCSLFR